MRAAANVGANGDPVQAKAGQTVADWLADFVPAVAARHAETAWPQTIVLDSTEFTWTNPRTRQDGVSYGEPVRELLAAAFTSREGWDAFDAAVMADPALPNTARWVRFWRKDMRVQTGRRASIPAHYANGAIEHPIAVVRQVLERRAWCFRNRARMDLLLQLVALRVRRVDDERVYASDIHQFLLDNAGKPARAYRDIYDTWGPKDNEKRVYSLRAHHTA